MSNHPFPPNSLHSHQRKKGRAGKKDILPVANEAKDIKLHQAENAWIPSFKMTVTDSSSEDMERNALKRNVQSLLNKLTYQKFKTLLGHLKKLNICTETEMALVVDLIYENAVLEPHFSAVYASLCKNLEKLTTSTGAIFRDEVEFTTILLTKCQSQFEEHCNDSIKSRKFDSNIEIGSAEDTKAMGYLIEQKDTIIISNEKSKNKRRRLGNIKFIGELFKLNMILKPVLHECVAILLMKKDDESLECLCLLLNTVAKHLESDKDEDEMSEVQEYFIRIQSLVDENLTSTRIRCLLKDVLDLKNNNWIPRKSENTPKTIDEIHKEAALEARKQWQWYQNMMYISANTGKQVHSETAHACCGACSCDTEKISTSQSKKDTNWSSPVESYTLNEARNILTNQSTRQSNSGKKKHTKRKNKKED